MIMRCMDNSEFEIGRPRKCPRLEGQHVVNMNEVNADREMNVTKVVNYGTGDLNLNIAPAPEASEGSDLSAISAPANSANPGPVCVPAPVQPGDCSLADNFTSAAGPSEGVPPGRTVMPRRRSRKGIPHRAPLF